MKHDTACSIGDGIIAYTARALMHIGGFDEIFIYDYENEKLWHAYFGRH